VLAGERLLDIKAKRKQEKIPFLVPISQFAQDMPIIVKYFLEYLNVFLLLCVLVSYLIPVFH
jgi:hypothetical protein